MNRVRIHSLRPGCNVSHTFDSILDINRAIPLYLPTWPHLAIQGIKFLQLAAFLSQ